ncbi:hypothetical protein [Micromonospora orduensis]|uniref:hypothetical protein n=1 Tax=Micromonospora orduensis TaxID=1420891 RepID=UPI001ABF4F08|nr:hypothetical protein [Micromonospora orduensis]
MRQLLGVADGVEPGDEAVVDAQRQDRVEFAVDGGGRFIVLNAVYLALAAYVAWGRLGPEPCTG